MWELDHKEDWAPKNWYFWSVVLEKTLENPLDCKEIKPVNSKLGNQSWIFIGRTDAKAKAPILWLPNAKSWLIGKDPDARKDWRQKEKGMTEDQMVGWHHWLDGHEFEQALGDGEGQGSLVCCSPSDHRELDTTEWLNNTNNYTLWHFPDGSSGKDHAYQWRRHKRRGFNPWVGKSLWRTAWQPTPVFFPREFHGKRSMDDYGP